MGVPVGKPTLAQSIFNDPKKVKPLTSRHGLVPEVFDISQRITSILDLLPMHSPAYKTYDISAGAFITNLEFIQWCLHQRMVGRKFLIVLDDVWEENIDVNCNVLQVNGSTIVVTTQNQDIARRFTLSLPWSCINFHMVIAGD